MRLELPDAKILFLFRYFHFRYGEKHLIFDQNEVNTEKKHILPHALHTLMFVGHSLFNFLIFTYLSFYVILTFIFMLQIPQFSLNQKKGVSPYAISQVLTVVIIIKVIDGI
jgi:hypothetical protein